MVKEVFGLSVVGSVDGSSMKFFSNHANLRIGFYGSTLSCNVDCGYFDIHPFSLLLPSHMAESLVMVRVEVKAAKSSQILLIKIDYKGDEPYVFAKDEDKPWQAPSELHLFCGSDYLKFLIDGEWFTTKQTAKEGNILPVSAGNLICEFFVAVKDQREDDSKRLAQELKKLAAKLEREKNQIDELLELLAQRDNLIGVIETKVANLVRLSTKITKVLEDERIFFSRTKVKKAIQIIGSDVPAIMMTDNTLMNILSKSKKRL